MDMMSIEDLAGMMGREFARIYKRFDHIDKGFDRIDKRFDRIEFRLSNVEEETGKLIDIDNRLAKIEYALDEAPPRRLKKRIEKLEKKTFGSVQLA